MCIIVSSLCCIGGTCYSFNVSIPLGHSRTYHFTSIKAFTLGTTVVHIMMKENATWQGRPAHFDSINEILAPWLLLSIPLRPSELIEFLLPSCIALHMWCARACTMCYLTGKLGIAPRTLESTMLPLGFFSNLYSYCNTGRDKRRELRNHWESSIKLCAMDPKHTFI